MALIDLHVHSQYSNNPDQWFMQRIGTQESYTTVEEVYAIAKNRGMDFVTITDHNTIEGALPLVENHAQDTFISVESTAYFPENGCKIHVLVFDITPQQFAHINHIRSDIYELRDYLHEQHLAHSVAHATYSSNGKLTFDLLEKLLLLFDVFEGINGSRDARYNTIWRQVLTSLRPEDIERLYKKHHIQPLSQEPWKKGITGGSDDHAGLLIGQTFTEAQCQTVAELMHQIKTKRTTSKGRSSDFKTVAFAFYKVAYDFSKHTTPKKSDGLLGLVNKMLFEDKRPSIRSRLAMKVMKRRRNEKAKIVTRVLDDLFAEFVNNGMLSIDEKIEKIYESIATMTDNFLAMICESVARDFKTGDIPALISNFSAILPALFLSAPFFSTIKYLSSESDLGLQLKREFLKQDERGERRTLWFSDTVHQLKDLVTILQRWIGSLGSGRRFTRLVTSSPTPPDARAFPLPLLNLPSIFTYCPSPQSPFTLQVVSLLKSLEMIHRENPDEVLLSTSGPIGMIGLLASRLLGIPAIGIYHSEILLTPEMTTHTAVANPIERYTQWFYSRCDEIYVPTREHFTMLEDQGVDAAKLRPLFLPEPHRSRA